MSDTTAEIPDTLTPQTLAPLLKWSDKTLRREWARAEERFLKHGEAGLNERDKAILTASTTPFKRLRWTRENAARLLRAWGVAVPAGWEVATQ